MGEGEAGGGGGFGGGGGGVDDGVEGEAAAASDGDEGGEDDAAAAGVEVVRLAEAVEIMGGVGGDPVGEALEGGHISPMFPPVVHPVGDSFGLGVCG